jgi:hypothetical protein
MSTGSLTILLIAFAVVCAVWGRSRIRARRRWRSALDSFARLQMSDESPARLLYESQASLTESGFRTAVRQTVTG